MRRICPQFAISEAYFLLEGFLGGISGALLGQSLVAGGLEVLTASRVDAQLVAVTIAIVMAMHGWLGVMMIGAPVMITGGAIARYISRSRMGLAHGFVGPTPIIEGVSVFGCGRHGTRS